jgi:hypothetical protein
VQLVEGAIMSTTAAPLGRAGGAPPAHAPDVAHVWHAISKASFAVISHVTPTGEPRSSGVVYGTAGRHLFVVTDPGSWKARQITDGARVAVTVPVRRGGLLAQLAPIPPATVSFPARVIVHPAGTVDLTSIDKRLGAMVPEQRRSGPVLELVPEGAFVTYGIDVSLRRMADPDAAEGRVPVG